MAVRYIILRSLAFIDFSTLRKKIHGDALLVEMTMKKSPAFLGRTFFVGGDNQSKSEHVYFINGMLVLLLNFAEI